MFDIGAGEFIGLGIIAMIVLGPEKLPRYAAIGVDELVTYRLRDGALRVWDRLDGDLVERIVDGPSTPLRTLGIHLLLPRGATTLAFAEDEEGTRPLLSRDAARAARLRAKLVAAGIDPEGD